MNITDKVNLGMITATAAAVVWMFTTFASAADVQDIQYTILKREIRELRKEIRTERSEVAKRFLQEDLQDAIDKLCRIVPEDRECA